VKEVHIDEEFFEGAVSLERTGDYVRPWRLPFELKKLFSNDGGLVLTAGLPAGVRLRFATDSGTIALKVVPYEDELKEGRLFDLTIDGKLVQTVNIPCGGEEAAFKDLPEGVKTVELWLPQAKPAALRTLMVETGAEVAAVPDDRPRWVTYGSSISHCSGAHSPARTWPACVARKRNLNLTCLGYGGNCHMEPMVALMIRDLPADIITLKVGINIMGAASLSPRTFSQALIGMVRIIREKHPDVPIAVVSPIISPPRETQQNAVGMSLTIMRSELEHAVSLLRQCGDQKVNYFNGLCVFGEDMVGKYLPDDLHPNGDGYEAMAENFDTAVYGKVKVQCVFGHALR